MNPADDDDELFTLRNLARPLGFWVGMHEWFDSTRGGGPYYLMPRKEFPEQKTKSLLRYATAAQIEKYLDSVGDHWTDRDEGIATLNGTVKFYSEAKGFGFIAPSDGSPDMFFHITSVPEDADAPVAGQKVEYEESQHKGKPCAIKVRYLS